MFQTKINVHTSSLVDKSIESTPSMLIITDTYDTCRNKELMTIHGDNVWITNELGALFDDG